MPSRIDGFRIGDSLPNQDFNYARNKPDIIMIHSMEIIHEVPLCERLNRFCADDN